MIPTLTFIAPPPGFAPLVDFTLNEIEGVTGLYALESATDAGVRLFVLDAALFLPEYRPVITDEQSSALALTAPDDAAVLVVANPGDGVTTMNLMAPIVVNRITGASAQVILEGQDWPLRAELPVA